MNCQDEAGPDGTRGIVGSLYTYAYSDTRFRVVPRLASGRVAVANCSGVEAVVQDIGAAAPGFGETEGYNPCMENPTPVKYVTWGSIKKMYGGDR